MKTYLEKHRRVLGGIGTLIACTVAAIYLSVVPEEASNADWIQKTILVYGHSLCWFLLGAASLLWSIKGRNKWSMPLVYIALTAYVIFLSILLF